MAKLRYHVGDLFSLMWKTKGKGKQIIIPHICNIQGAWGAGFVLAITKHAPTTLPASRCPEKAYKVWYDYQNLNDNDFSMDAWHKKRAVEDRIEGATVTHPFELGEIQLVDMYRDHTVDPVVNSDWKDPTKYTEVVNMLAQDGFRRENNPRPVRYDALASCMMKLRDLICLRRSDGSSGAFKPAEIHCPEFGAHLGGGNWDFIEELITDIWVKADIDVHVHQFKG